MVCESGKAWTQNSYEDEYLGSMLESLNSICALCNFYNIPGNMMLHMAQKVKFPIKDFFSKSD